MSFSNNGLLGISEARKVIALGIFLALSGFGIIQAVNWLNTGYSVAKPVIDNMIGDAAPPTPLMDATPGWIFFLAGIAVLGGGVALGITKNLRH